MPAAVPPLAAQARRPGHRRRDRRARRAPPSPRCRRQRRSAGRRRCHAARRPHMGPVGRVADRALQSHDLPAELELLASRRRPSARGSIARRRGPTARCCASTSSSPSTARSRSRPASSFRPGRSTARCPGPTLRATEGDRVRVTFINQGTHPHTIHFHGWHPPEMDGSLPEHQVHAGRQVRLRVRRRALRPAPLSLPRGAA